MEKYYYAEDFIKDFEIDGKFKVKQVTSDIVIYYKLNGEGNGFDFYVIELTGEEMIEFKVSKTIIDILYHGNAFYDGIRHLYFGHKNTDNEGYFFCVNIQEQIEIMKSLRELEITYCKLV